MKYRQSRCDVMFRIVMLLRSDVMFAHYAARRNITSAGNITPKGASLARKGKHRSKTKSTAFAVLFVLGVLNLMTQIKCA